LGLATGLTLVTGAFFPTVSFFSILPAMATTFATTSLILATKRILRLHARFQLK
jgi:hypothetical protein